MNSIRQIEVIYDNRPVGRMALLKDGLCAFEYSNECSILVFDVCEKRFNMHRALHSMERNDHH